ncbi:MAG: PolC-type DNA polymerase III [Eubacteriales bacterium]
MEDTEKKIVYFLDMFQGFTPPEESLPAVKQAVICRGFVDASTKTLEVVVQFPKYVTCRDINQLELDLESEFNIKRVKIQAVFPEELLETMNFGDLGTVLSRAYSPARAILAGAKWRLEDDVLHCDLRANGKAQLTTHLPLAERFIDDHFGRQVKLELHANEVTDPKELFAQTEKIRKEAVKNMAFTPVFDKKTGTVAPPKPVEINTDLIYGKPFRGQAAPMETLSIASATVILEGEVFAVNHKDIKSRNATVINFDVTDRTGSVRVSQFMENAKAKPILDAIKKPGKWVRLQGKMAFDSFENGMVLRPYSVMAGSKPERKDTAKDKRVELHLHTNMSAMDALTKAGDVVKLAAKWGHKAIAITDHGVLQGYPGAMHAAEHAKVAGTDELIKVLYGVEAYFINDVDEKLAVHGGNHISFEDEFVVFDLETTGLSNRTEKITEIGAAVYRNGEMVEEFQTLVNPGKMLSQKIIDLTGITDFMLKDAPTIDQVLPGFLEFVGNRPLVAHNAEFDIGFISAACRELDIPFEPTYVDTLVLAQNLLPSLKKYKLNLVAEALDLPAFNHHRAVDDAKTLGYMMEKFIPMLKERGVTSTADINRSMVESKTGRPLNSLRSRHMIIYAKNQVGLRNLYRLVSYGHLKYFRKTPRIPKSELIQWREGLIIGSACEAGDLFQAIIDGKSHAEQVRIASFYDFLEIQPICNNMFMLDKGLADSVEQLRDFNRTVIALGKELGKPVVATGDVHYMDPEDEIYRRMLLASKGFSDCDRDLPLYFRSTDDMLREFAYLGEETAMEIVVENTNLIADMCEVLRPVPHNLFAPSIANSVEDLNELVYGKLERLYGKNPPELMVKRVETELNDIISCHYDVIYMSAQRLVQNSLEHGYLVGSRGSVGSSIVAYLSGITEVNSFPPHYRCPACKFATFDIPKGVACGADLPDDHCPHCGAQYEKDGFNIPFETFLGFGGDKVPDIDLNFSGEYQAQAHAYCVEMFGATQVFRAGTIGTIAEKTAYGYAKKYLAERNRTESKAEENRLAAGCVGVRKSTGQHPGGLVVIPAENEIYDFCPVQRPADDVESNTITTHFEYHCMEENLLKLDMLGHDDPTMIRMMEDLTGVNAQEIPLDDQDTMSIFTSSVVLGFEDDKLLGSTGACGIPEFGTSFVRGMLMDTQPSEFDVLVRLSGFSHGTDVWLGNAKDLIVSGTASVKDAIGCRDDIMIYLIQHGMPEQRSFKIMEGVRKGRGLPPGAEEEMVAANVPTWYIESCKKIKYLFPKAHAVAYVMMAFRIAWFKVHHPLAFYSAYFYRRSQKGGFDAALMTRGKELVLQAIKDINDNPEASNKDEDLKTTMELCYEFYLRGFTFDFIDLYSSHATKFNIQDGKLLPPFISVAGLGETAAWDMMEGSKGQHFISIEEFSRACPKVSKTHIENLKQAGAFGDLPETSQVSLF